MSLLIPLGNEATDWYDVTVAAGTPVSIFISSDVDGEAANDRVRFQVAFKAGVDNYQPLDIITPGDIAAKGVIAASGTFGIRRLEGDYDAALYTEE